MSISWSRISLNSALVDLELFDALDQVLDLGLVVDVGDVDRLAIDHGGYGRIGLGRGRTSPWSPRTCRRQARDRPPDSTAATPARRCPRPAMPLLLKLF